MGGPAGLPRAQIAPSQECLTSLPGTSSEVTRSNEEFELPIALCFAANMESIMFVMVWSYLVTMVELFPLSLP